MLLFSMAEKDATTAPVVVYALMSYPDGRGYFS